MQKIYVDTNVFISYWDKEYGRNIGDFLEYFSEEILKRVVKCEFYLIISDFVIEELLSITSLNKKEILKQFNPYFSLKKIKISKINKKDWEKADKLAKKYKIWKGDALHAIKAKQENAIVITWDIKHFSKLEDYVLVRSPKEL